MNKWTMIALVFLLVGVVLVLMAVPQLGSEVVARETVSTNATHTTLGPHDLPRGSYTVWMEDFREDYEADQWNAYLIDEDEVEMYWGDDPEEVRTEEFEGVECELLGANGNVPPGAYFLVMETDADPNATGEEVEVFLVRSPGSIEAFMVVTGLTLVVVAVIVVVVTRWPKVPDQECHRQV